MLFLPFAAVAGLLRGSATVCFAFANMAPQGESEGIDSAKGRGFFFTSGRSFRLESACTRMLGLGLMVTSSPQSVFDRGSWYVANLAGCISAGNLSFVFRGKKLAACSIMVRQLQIFL